MKRDLRCTKCCGGLAEPRPRAGPRRPARAAGVRGRRPTPPAAAEGNEFPSEDETRRLLADADFALEAAGEADLGDSPEEWTRRADAVDAEIERRHGADPAYRLAQEQSGRIGRLLSDGALRPWLGVAVAA